MNRCIALTLAFSLFVGTLSIAAANDGAHLKLYTTKGSLAGDFVGWFKGLFTAEQQAIIADYVRMSGFCLVFEVIDPFNVPLSGILNATAQPSGVGTISSAHFCTAWKS